MTLSIDVGMQEVNLMELDGIEPATKLNFTKHHLYRE